MMPAVSFNRTIYITDPAYIGLSDEFGERWEDMVIPECTDHIVKYTGIGDGRWTVYRLNSDKKPTIKQIKRMIDKEDFSACDIIGTYGVDSTLVCLVYKDEADKFNPRFVEEYADARHCYTQVEDFVGDVYLYEDRDYVLHFIGIGNYCFFTA